MTGHTINVLLCEKCGTWAGGMAQAEEHLSSKYEVLSSNPSTIKEKKKEGWRCGSRSVVPALQASKQP
jgi:hypothetical protein